MIIAIFLVSLLAISAASASEDVDDVVGLEEATGDIVGLDDVNTNFDNISNENDEQISSPQEDAVGDGGSGSFTELSIMIHGAEEGSTVDLQKDYSFGENDSEIEISKSLTINGNGHTIDACGQSGIFNIISGTSNVVLNNIKFMGGKNKYGGAIGNEGYNLTISSCDFIGCTGAVNDYGYFDSQNYGGAIFNNYNAGNLKVDSCSFSECSSYNGGAICNYGAADCKVTSCLFNDCYAENQGGAVFNDGSSFTINDCIFTDCSASFQGGAIFTAAQNCNINSCIFTDCSAGTGYAVYNNEHAGTAKAKSCKFPDLSSDQALYKTTYENCTFKKPSAYIYVGYNDIVYGEDLIISVSTYTSVEMLYVTLSCVNETRMVEIKEGEGNTTFSGVEPGTYDIEVYFPGNSQYAQTTVHKNVTVNKFTPVVEISDVQFDYGSYGLVNVTILGNVTLESFELFYYEGGEYISEESNIIYSEETHVINVTAYRPGSFILLVVTGETVNYCSANVTANVIVNKANPNLVVLSADNITLDENLLVVFGINEEATGNVNVTVNGRPYETEIHEGSFSIVLENVSVGIYTVTAYYPGNEYILSDTVSVDVAVSKLENFMEIDIDRDAYEYEPFSIFFYMEEGSTGYIIFTMSNGFNGSAEYDFIAGCGVFEFGEGLPAGNYTVSAFSEGDYIYGPCDATFNFTVNEKAPLPLTVNITDVYFYDDVVLTVSSTEDVEVHVKLNEFNGTVMLVNGSWTHDFGCFVPGVYALEVAFAGNEAYARTVITKNVTVSKVEPSIRMAIFVGDIYSDEPLGIQFLIEGASGYMNVTLGDMAPVRLQVVDGSCEFILEDGVAAGTYALVAEYEGDEFYEPASLTTNITVKQKVYLPLTVSAADVISYGDDLVVFVSSTVPAVVDVYVDNDAESKRTISLENLSAPATFSNLGLGLHDIMVSYPGDSAYFATVVHKNVTVRGPIVTSDNFNSFFNQDGELIRDVPELIFEGSFDGKVLNINRPVTVIGDNAVFMNSRFVIKSDDVAVRNIEVHYGGPDSIIEINGYSNFTLENNMIDFSVSAGECYALNIANSNGATIFNNTIEVRGPRHVECILISDSNFTVDSNKLVVRSGEDAEGFKITGSSKGVVENNDLDAQANKTFYGFNSSSLFNNSAINFIRNVLSIESFYAVGSIGDSQSLKDNKFTLKSNYGVGIIAHNNAELLNNEIVVDATNTGSSQGVPEDVETVGIMVKGACTAVGNTVTSTGKSMTFHADNAVAEGNTLIGGVEALANNLKFSYNDVSVTNDVKAVKLAEGTSGCQIIDNTASALGTTGNDAILDAGTNNVLNNKANPRLNIAHIDDIVIGQGVVIVISAFEEFTGDVAVQVGGYNTTATVTNGKCNVSVSADKLTLGEVTVTVSFGGNESYSNSSASTKFTVKPKVDPKLNITHIDDIIEGQGVVIVITADSEFTGDVAVQVGDYNTTASITNGRGNVAVPSDVLAVGEVLVKASFNENDYYTSSSANATFAVKAKLNPKLTISVAGITQGANAVIKITTDPAFTGNVNVKIGSKNYVVNVVKGKGSKSVSGLAVGTYTAKATFAATELFAASTKSVTFKVAKKPDEIKLTLAKVKVKKSSKNLVIKATLKVNGKAKKGLKVNFKFNKKSYTVKTDKKGVAKLTIGKKVLKKLKKGKKVTYQASYATKTVKQTVKVQK
jgi:hypothetical protein